MNIEQLRKFCLAFPGATEDIKWGADLCFCVGKKMFCVTGADSIQSGLSLKCTPEKFEELIEREGIDPAAYVGRYKWVRIQDLDAVTPPELKISSAIRTNSFLINYLPGEEIHKLKASP